MDLDEKPARFDFPFLRFALCPPTTAACHAIPNAIDHDRACDGGDVLSDLVLSVPDGTNEAVTTQLHNVICILSFTNSSHVRAPFNPYHFRSGLPWRLVEPFKPPFN